MVVYPVGKTANAGKTKKVCSYRDGGPARWGRRDNRGRVTGCRRARE